MNNKVGIFLLTFVCLTGCATSKIPEPTGGSRADGTIELSYEHGEFEQPVIDKAQANEAAKARCKAWGYTDSEPFGGMRKTCEAPGGLGGCSQWLVTIKYQCLGDLK
jgi:YecR-like lipoprotein